MTELGDFDDFDGATADDESDDGGDDLDEDTRASEQFDLTAGMDFAPSPEDVEDLAAELEAAEAANTGEASEETLAEWVAALKRLEDAVEDARKNVFEQALDDHVEEGETVGALRKQSGTSRFVTDDAGAFEAVREAGHDPSQVAEVKASVLADVLGDDADEYVGESTYTYYRRS